MHLAIEWDVLVAEMTLLAAIIYGAIYVENWVEKRNMHRKEKEDARRFIRFVTNDLKKNFASWKTQFSTKISNRFLQTCGTL